MQLTPDIISEVLFSSAITFGREKGKVKNQIELPKFILADMAVAAVLSFNDDGSVQDYGELRTTLNAVINKKMHNNTLEFVYYDVITHSVILFTDEYLTKLETGETKIKDLVMRYFKLWYAKKCGSGRNQTEGYNEQFKTFSKTEVEYLRRQLIPIATVPRDLTAVHNAIEYAIQVSPLHPHIVKDTGFDIKGSRVEQSTTWWIHHPIAKIYLDTDNDLDVLSESILTKLLEDCGFSDKESLTEIKELDIDLSEMNLTSVNDLIAQKYGYADDNQRIAEVKRIISTNALADDDVKEETPPDADEVLDLTSLDVDWH